MLRHRTYLLSVLFAFAVFSAVDGVAFRLVLQEIKQELVLTDTQLGLLTGIAFALLYSFMGLAIARWADRGDRIAVDAHINNAKFTVLQDAGLSNDQIH